MITLPPDISDAERAVSQYKRELLVRVMAHILRRALVQGTYRVVVLRASGRGPGFRPQDVVLSPA